jgi:transcriptional regulator with GAF, ATPase, and Fis domain
MSRSYNKTVEIIALYEISKILGSSLNLRSNLRGVMRVLSEYLDMNRGTVALRNNNEVMIIAAHGMTEEEIKRGRYRLGEGIIGRVAKHGSPIVIPNIGGEPLFLNKTGSRKTIKKENIAFLCKNSFQAESSDKKAGWIQAKAARMLGNSRSCPRLSMPPFCHSRLSGIFLYKSYS